MRQGIRIIGGKYRGKKLVVPDSEGLRPTSDRMRETLFNWLMHEIVGARCLDAFAGSGALGFEAFSRGAREVIMLEHCARVAASLRKTAAELGTGIRVHHRDALQYLEREKQPYDIVFLDPPFALNCWDKCLHTLVNYHLLAPGARVFLESPYELSLDASQWQCLKCKKAGNVVYALYQYARPSV